MSGSLQRQDASGHMPLAVCLDGAVVATVPESDSYGYETLRRVAADMERPARDFEVLLPCHKHPGTSAVDCLECEPIP